MKNYSDHIAIIGAGIAGLTLGCVLKKEGIPVIIFEKSESISNYGAGISISNNGISILKKIGIFDNIKQSSSNPKVTRFFSKRTQISSFEVNVITTSREVLYRELLNKYYSYGGEILFNHCLNKINIDNSEVSFTNNYSFKVHHIAACDGIRSLCRSSIGETEKPIYSGYSVWRALIDKRQEDIKTFLGPNHHIVTYPINKDKVSFVAAIKTTREIEDSWRQKGTYDELRNDLKDSNENFYSFLKNHSDIYKWGIYTRSTPKTIFKKNITLLGDAAHPIVPFLGQGGCLALEDSYVFGKLILSLHGDLNKIQNSYEDLRLKRIYKIKNLSERQGYLNHISNPVMTLGRNMIMKFFPSIAMHSIREIWGYDVDNALTKIKH